MSVATETEDYDIVDWIMIGISAFIIIGYHIVFRKSKIQQHQDSIWIPWADIMERTYKNSITAVQMLRNIMRINAFLGSTTITGATLLVSLREDGLVPAIEMSVVAGMYIISFINFGLCCRFIHHLTLLISLYPMDLNLEGDEEIKKYSEANKRRVRELLTLLSRHNAIGREVLLIAIPVTFVIFSRIALLVATVTSAIVWYYMDTKFGTVLGGRTVPELDEMLNKEK